MSRRLSPIRALAVVVGITSVVGSAREALATPNFPGAIAVRLGGPPPDCAICHVNRVTQRGTVNTAWGSAMRERGLVAYDEGSLARALSAMEADRVDSDGDGTIDVEAVRAGANPNGTAAPMFEDPTIPKYGCLSVSGGAPADTSVATAFVALLLVLAGRRRLRIVPPVACASALAAACAPQNGHALAPRTDEARHEAPRMPKIRPSTLAADVRAAGLDPMALPRFEDLAPRQRRRIMSTFTRALGVPCTGCHDRNDFQRPTEQKQLAVAMWNGFTRSLAFTDGQPLYCDSCHQGQPQYLARSDHETIASYMSESFAEALVRSERPKEPLECETCHGVPVEPRFLAKWKSASPSWFRR